jgi:hypothetical protein
VWKKGRGVMSGVTTVHSCDLDEPTGLAHYTFMTYISMSMCLGCCLRRT